MQHIKSPQIQSGKGFAGFLHILADELRQSCGADLSLVFTAKNNFEKLRHQRNVRYCKNACRRRGNSFLVFGSDIYADNNAYRTQTKLYQSQLLSFTYWSAYPNNLHMIFPPVIFICSNAYALVGRCDFSRLVCKTFF